MDLIKKIWKDPVGSKVISVGVLALLNYLASILLPVVKEFYLTPIPLWVVCILSLFIYFLTKMSIYYSKKEHNERKKKDQALKANQNAWQKNKDAIWGAFVGLDNNDMQILMKLYNSGVIDPDNEHVRMVNDSDYYLYEPIIEKTKIPTSSSIPYERTFQVCITFKKMGNKIHYTFDQYFFSLLMYYAQTGKKLKL